MVAADQEGAVPVVPNRTHTHRSCLSLSSRWFQRVMMMIHHVRLCLLLLIVLLSSCREQDSEGNGREHLLAKRELKSNVHLTVAETPDWYNGLGLEVSVESIPEATFFIWPQEAWDYSRPGTAKRKWEFVRKTHLKDLVVHPDGTITYETTKLMRDDVSFKVRISPGLDQVTIIHEIINQSREPLSISSVPCVQLPEGMFGGNHKWERAKNVFTVTKERGLTWISDTVQTSGNYAICPWSQVFRHDKTSPIRVDGFGLSPDLATVNLAGAVSDSGSHLVAVVSEGYPRTAYAWLNCLHVTPTKLFQPEEKWSARVTVYFSSNDLERLFGRIAKDFPGIKVPHLNKEFPRPGSKHHVLESFEDKTSQAWSVLNGRVAAHQPVQSRFPATHGVRCLDVELDENGILASPELRVEVGQVLKGNLCFDVMDLASTPDEKLRQKVVEVPSTIRDANDATIRVSITGLEKKYDRECLLSNGTYRRIVIPIDSLKTKADLRIAIRSAYSERKLRLRLDCFSFFPSR